ncbi:DMT family transporter [Chitinophaga sp. Cy-1792]|uniref:DMT family transporter n=1 Tax=Chitinophaga sp. Cy-1792 TaxID=2608339 RepID=UPI001422E91D|nr:DMT family transporter [Chitinophaga sp. Cy-1792]NIG55512.1 EamA family transporter [Chitinophaga sp. Cy-1792]
MSTLSLILVLIAAIIHALWNLITKQVKGGLPFFWLLSLFSAVIFAPVLIYQISSAKVEITSTAIWLALGSGLLHIFYYIALQVGYHKADLSVVYPVARGAGPLFSVTGAILLFGERPGIPAYIGFVLIITGVILLTGLKLSGSSKQVLTGLNYGLLTGIFIAGYTLWDKKAVADYHISPLFISFGSMILPLLALTPVAIRKSEEVKVSVKLHWKAALMVSILQPVSYLLVLIAMKTTPVSYVAPVRELSIVIGVFFGVNLLKEKDATRRMIGAVIILAGIALLAFS